MTATVTITRDQLACVLLNLGLATTGTGNECRAGGVGKKANLHLRVDRSIGRITGRRNLDARTIIRGGD